MQDHDYFKGKGAQINTFNRFDKHHLAYDHVEGLDEQHLADKPKTEIFYETPKKIISRNDSPDLPFDHSVNPYQGCEHGCIYCYARNSHEYWGFSAGLDFESKIIVKKDAPQLLEEAFLKKSWKPSKLMLSGNTDCYQPLEQRFELTRAILKVCLRYRNPVGIITKNALITRDIDILKELASHRLVHVYLSITTLDEKLRQLMEPRTASAVKKLRAIRQLTNEGIPVGIMNAPIIPGLNHHEIPKVLEAAAHAGAKSAGYTVVRLNGQIADLTRDWLFKNFPDRAQKVWNQVCELHGGNVNDSEFGRRQSGEGSYADIIKQLFKKSQKKYFEGRSMPKIDMDSFRRGGNYQLF
ncbi:MAG: PA0069 family radical SAM protein [Cytophagales bacterium]|nr:PA0069 family radical SAM protein [Cytophagales bacterium]